MPSRAVVELLSAVAGPAAGVEARQAVVFLGLRPSLLVALAIALCIISVAFSIRAAALVDRRLHRVAIVALRVLALCVIMAALLEPNVVRTEYVYRKPRLLIAVDTSLSMSLPSRAGGRSRLELVKEHLRANMSALESLAENMELSVCTFDSDVTYTTLKQLVGNATARGEETNLQPVFDEATKAADAGPVTLLVYTDGRETFQGSTNVPAGSRAAGLTAGANMRVFAFSPGPAGSVKDIRLEAVSASTLAFTRTPWEGRFRLTAQGYEGGRFSLVLRSGKDVLTTRQVEIKDSSRSVEFSAGFTPARAGKMLLTLETPARVGELLEENNHVSLLLNVVRERIRVMHVAGRPSWDVRFLREALKQDPVIDLISFYIMRTPWDWQDYEEESRLNLIPFPTHELFTRQIGTFDVVVFQNFDYRPYEGGPLRFATYLENVRREVVDNGAGLVMIGGDQSFSGGGYHGTAIVDILPVAVSPETERIDASDFVPKPSPAWREHPIAWGSPSLRGGELPTLAGCNVVPPGESGDAAVLWEHPSAKVAGSAAPILAVRNAGKGRTLALMSDSLWRWGFRSAVVEGTNRRYVEFWQRCMRWLVHDPVMRRLHLTCGRMRCRRGESLDFGLKAIGPNGFPARGCPVEYGLVRGDGELARLGRVECDGRGEASFAIRFLNPGVQNVLARMMEGDIINHSDCVAIEVYGPQAELENAEICREFLSSFAGNTGGRFKELPCELSVGEIASTHGGGRVPRGRRLWPIWSTLHVLLVGVGLLAGEWWLRRQVGLG